MAKPMNHASGGCPAAVLELRRCRRCRSCRRRRRLDVGDRSPSGRCPPARSTTPSIIVCSNWSCAGSSDLARSGSGGRARQHRRGSGRSSRSTRYGCHQRAVVGDRRRRSSRPAAASSARPAGRRRCCASEALGGQVGLRPDGRLRDRQRHRTAGSRVEAEQLRLARDACPPSCSTASGRTWCCTTSRTRRPACAVLAVLARLAVEVLDAVDAAGWTGALCVRSRGQ